MEKDATILVTGASGLVGTALISRLEKENHTQILKPTAEELDLRDENAVNKYFKENKIDFVFHLAAKVGSFEQKKNNPLDFLYDNIKISCNVIDAAKKNAVKKLIFMGTSYIYAENAQQPFQEEHILTGKLDELNEPYAIAKIMGLQLCEYYNQNSDSEFIGLIACNLFGPNDDFKLHPHLLPRLIKQIHEAKQNNDSKITVPPKSIGREFLFAEDLVDALLFFMSTKEKIQGSINIGTGKTVTVEELTQTIAKVVDYQGEIKFEDGEATSRVLDVSKAQKLGWQVKTSLEEGIEKTYQWYNENQ